MHFSGFLRSKARRAGPSALQARRLRLLWECPEKCRGRHSTRQRPLTEDELEAISESAREVIALSLGSPPYKCTHCGCVYLREPQRNLRLGTLNGLRGLGWRSRTFP